MGATSTANDIVRDDRVYRYLNDHDPTFLRGLPSWVVHALAYGSEAEVIEEDEGPVFLWASPYAYPGSSRYVFAFVPHEKCVSARHHVRLSYVGDDGGLYYADGVEGYSACFVGFGEAPRFPPASYSVSVTAFEWPDGIMLDQLDIDRRSQAKVLVESMA